MLVTKTVPADKIHIALSCNETYWRKPSARTCPKTRPLQDIPHETHFIGNVEQSKTLLNMPTAFNQWIIFNWQKKYIIDLKMKIVPSIF